MPASVPGLGPGSWRVQGRRRQTARARPRRLGSPPVTGDAPVQGPRPHRLGGAATRGRVCTAQGSRDPSGRRPGRGPGDRRSGPGAAPSLLPGPRGRHSRPGLLAVPAPSRSCPGGAVSFTYFALLPVAKENVKPLRTPLTQVLPMALLSLPRLWQLALPLGPPSHFPSLWTGSAQLTAPAGIPISSPR